MVKVELHSVLSTSRFTPIMNSASLLCLCLIGIIVSSPNVVDSATVYERGVSDHDKHVIVNKHNEFRRMISEGRVPGQPRGTNLRPLKYDENLAREAQKISDTCRFAHVKVHDKRWHSIGQNLHTSYSTTHQPKADWAQAVQNWFDEYPHYKYGDRTTNPANGHYTQVVWANTEYVGCGYTVCKGTSWPYEKIYICNYGPAGNYKGELPYKT